MESGRDSLGVLVVIRLLALSVASILCFESTQDHKITGQMVSPSSSREVNPSWSTNHFEMQLILDPESNKQRP